MKISIIVPVYNAERYLEECILSVVKQTNRKWELILVNDGSKDDSSKICDFYASKYNDKIKVFHKHNEGQFFTRQYGIKHSTGEYVGFLDADDTLHFNYVENVLKTVEQHNKPDVVCFEFYEKSETEEKLFELPKIEKINYFNTNEDRRNVYRHIISGGISGAMCSKVFRRDFMDSITIENEELCTKRYGEDAYQSFTLLSHAAEIVFLREPLYFYRVNEQGASKGFSNRPLDYYSTRYVFELINNCLSKWGMDNEEYKSLLYARNFNETVYYMLNYYRSAIGIGEKRRIIDYDWDTYLLDEAKKGILNNPYIRRSYLKVWKAFQKHAYCEIALRETFKKLIGW